MKKLFFLMVTMLVSLSLVLTGCGGNEGTQESENGGEETAPVSKLDQIKERGKLIVGVKYDVNLFGLKDPKSGDVLGYDVDVARALAKDIFGEDKNLENILELKQVNSKTRMELVKNGEIDFAIATATITEEREQIVDFSNVYFIAGQSLLVHKDSPIESIEDLGADTTVIAVKGSTSEKNIKKAAPEAPVQLYDDYAQAFTALKAGKGEVLTTDNSILMGMNKQDANYVLRGGLFTEEPYGAIFNQDDDEFREYVNNFLNDMKESGQLEEIYNTWFSGGLPEDILKENPYLN